MRRLFLSLVALISIFFTAVAQQPSFEERQLRQLTLRGERVEQQIAAAEQAYATLPNDSLGKVIHSLRNSHKAITEAISSLQTKLTEKVETEATTDKVEVEESEATAVETNEIEIRIKELYSAARRRYALTMGEIEELCVQMTELHNQLALCTKGYDIATNLATTEHNYVQHQKLSAEANTLLDDIADRSELLFESMSAAYETFADSLGMHEDIAAFKQNQRQMESQMTERMKGEVADMDLAMYPYRKAVMLNMEAKLSRRLIGQDAAQESIAKMEALKPESYALPNLPTIKHTDGKWAEVEIKKGTPKYKSVGALPRIKIPSKGEAYSILLGYYANPPAITAFRGATPLYTERRPDGKTYIYTGLYPTDMATTDAIEMLRKAGFKQPQVVMWYNGLRRDDYVDRITAPKVTIYTIEIGGAGNDGLGAEVVAAIRKAAPKKEISKYTSPEGQMVYTIGSFSSQAEAESVRAAVAKADNELSATITTITK